MGWEMIPISIILFIIGWDSIILAYRLSISISEKKNYKNKKQRENTDTYYSQDSNKSTLGFEEEGKPDTTQHQNNTANNCKNDNRSQGFFLSLSIVRGIINVIPTKCKQNLTSSYYLYSKLNFQTIVRYPCCVIK